LFFIAIIKIQTYDGSSHQSYGVLLNRQDHTDKKDFRIDSLRLDLLVSQGQFAIIVSALVSLILAAVVIKDITSFLVLMIWVTFVIVIAVFRQLFIFKVKRKLSPPDKVLLPAQINRYELIYAVGAFCSGLSLGVLAFFIDTSWPTNIQALVPFVLVGASVSAIGSNLSSLPSYYAFVIPLLLPLIFGMYNTHIEIAGLLIFIHLLFMMVLVKRLNTILIDSLTLRFRNEDLKGSHDQQSELLEKLRQSEQLSSGAFNEAGVAMGLVDNYMRIFKINQAACHLFGYEESELLGMSLLTLSHASDRQQSELFFAELVAGKRPQYQLRKRYLAKSGESIWVDAIVSSVQDSKGHFEYAVVHSQDVSQEHELTEKLMHQAQHDALTGLPNRSSFEMDLQSLLSSKDARNHVLCYLDLDQFKVVNDTCGHSAGDELLRQLAVVMKQGLRESDLLARIGGDEFAILMFNCTMETAERQLTLLLTKVRNFRFIYGKSSFNVGASLGLVNITSSSTMTEVLKQADSACYAAKDAGRDRLHIYRPDDLVLAQRTGEMQWVSRIQQALAEDKMVLYFQEIVQIDGKAELPHYELLIRMQGNDGKVISPHLFLPAAERYNLAAAIDLWVVDHVISTLQTAHSEGKDINGIYGINLSGHSLGDTRFYEDIIERIRENDLREFGAFICFEITETAAITNMTAALHFITELRAVGCQFALDDFGSGLSSFAYLKQMPIDYLKIDGMFVKDCLTDPVNLAMIDSINGIGHVMGLKTIAEFVENQDIFDKLKELGVDYAQGYWAGPPQPWIISDSEWLIE